jgi:hypothetical protein
VTQEELPERQSRAGPGADCSNAILKAGLMAQQPPQRNGRAAGQCRNDNLQVVVDVAIKVEFVTLDELHDRQGGQRFGDRPDPDRRVGPYEPIGGEISVTVSLTEYARPVLHNDDDRTCDSPSVELPAPGDR